MDQAWKAEIEKEYASLKANDAVLHNKELHRTILENWKQHSPKMWANLQAAGMTDKLAYVLQERMWVLMNALMKGGMPYTDAQEQAEREILMLEPEEAVQDRSLPWTPPVPKSVLTA